MQISEKEDDESEKREEPGDSWEETGGGVDRSSGPWNKSAPAPAPVVEPIVTETPEPVQTGGVYRPPGAREGGRPRRAQQGPPEIYSDTQFPSLQSTAKLVDSRNIWFPEILAAGRLCVTAVSRREQDALSTLPSH
ncbi:protein CDV3 homolog isoform X2 [Egretta garzetta]|uniref:protein CDV3 homolog isoform X2 n=1 Tax=Egretta garzetta TaxID=188379 RepID=UPI00163C912E|nr:protein CDV3 homolog isoform X2 [Egretta garzetta]